MRRPTRMVQRLDRHVPLTLGVYCDYAGFTELFCTHAHNAGSGAVSLNTPAYDKFLAPLRQLPQHSLERDTIRFVDTLDRGDKLPAIVFCLNRERCVRAAHSISQNLLIRPKITRCDPDASDDAAAEEAELRQQTIVAVETRRAQDRMFRRHLLPHKVALEGVPGYDKFKELLDRGVGYHHAGMLPILREYVELLFQQKLLRVVFATETLGVGINMPARTVVFTQLHKRAGDAGERDLRPDEFWQMAGRSGRRGIDTHGYIVYWPQCGRPPSSAALSVLLTGSMPTIQSQLRIEPSLLHSVK